MSSMTREQMDALVNEHFGFEASDDVDGVMGTLDDDAEHEVIASPVGLLNDPAEQRRYYEKVSFRLLHVFEIRDGKITREQAWCDLAAIARQLGCTVS